MKILYAIQGTGNGHITVAREVIPLLQKRAQVDILLSGTQVDVDLPYPIKYRLHGLCFVFGKNGGIDYIQTYKKSRIKRLFHEIRQLPVEEYDLVISDFEPVSSWACFIRNQPCIGFSHQASVIKKGAPKPKKTDLLGKAVLKHYAPASSRYGFHFLPYDKNIFTPIIRQEIRQLATSNNGHYTVYLPAYSDQKLIRFFSLFQDKNWEVFSKHSDTAYTMGNIVIRPVEHDGFIRSMASAEGVVCGAGFQTPSEVLYLKKKLLVIPMKGQYEQQCNAAALKLLGVPVLKNLKLKHYEEVKNWMEEEYQALLSFPDETEYILDEILDQTHETKKKYGVDEPVTSPSKFRELILKKIFYQLKA